VHRHVQLLQLHGEAHDGRGPRVRQAPRMTTLFAPALRTACKSEAMSATLRWSKF
jgi:hypothetical protein